MTHRPIIFRAPEVRALLEGRKTMMQRVIKGVPMFSAEYDNRWRPHASPPGGAMPNEWTWWEGPAHGPSLYHKQQLLYAPGDLLWVKETWREGEDGVPASIFFFADEPWHEGAGWRSSTHMPRWASRLTLRVTGVHVQRLQDISEDDCFREGVDAFKYVDDDDGEMDYYSAREPEERFKDEHCVTRKDAFAALWQSTHGPGSWDANPWVAAISFEVIKTNIDRVKS